MLYCPEFELFKTITGYENTAKTDIRRRGRLSVEVIGLKFTHNLDPNLLIMQA